MTEWRDEALSSGWKPPGAAHEAKVWLLAHRLDEDLPPNVRAMRAMLGTAGCLLASEHPEIGAIDNNAGYYWMQVGAPNGSRLLVHHVAWILYYGTMPPPGKVQDHTCENKPCFQPLHLEAVTHSENIRRITERRRERDREGTAREAAEERNDAAWQPDPGGPGEAGGDQ